MVSALAKCIAGAVCLLVVASLLVLYFGLYAGTGPNEQQSVEVDHEESTFRNASPPAIDFRHHTNAELRSFLASYANHYPNLVRKYSIGQSVRGNDLVALEISDNPGTHEPGEPEIKLVGNIHGNEVVCRELLLYLVDYLLKNYHTHAIRSLVDSVRLHIVPSINPDGYEDASEGDCDGAAGRENANGVDLNRNFPDQFGANGRAHEPETASVIEWTRQHPFVLSAAFHGGALVVNYPFDSNDRAINQYTKSPDDQVFRHLALVYSAANADMKKGRCADRCNGEEEFFENGITNGAAWYPISGGMQDWNYLEADCLELTIELGCRKYPRSDELAHYWETNLDSIVRLINAVHLGVHGFVLDQSGVPVAGATVSVLGVDKNVTSHISGDYWRLLTPNAQYTLTASKQGYMPHRITVQIEQSYLLNFTLHSLP